MPRTVEVTAPSRLHFGLFAFGNGAERSYGGVGAMIAEPAVRLRAAEAEAFAAVGHHAARVSMFASRYAESFGLAAPPACRLEVLAAPAEHTGLGLGTQLGMSVAATLTAFEGRAGGDAEQLAAAVGRGDRSAVGAHGFRHGGLIVDDGKALGDELGRLACRVPLPADWRFVLVRPSNSAGLAGVAEADAFDQLPSPPPATTADLRRLATAELVPAAERADFDRFSVALHQFNVLAGECFAAVQGGPFASPAIADTVRRLQELGCVGCGQSSWGPTVFGLASSEAEARRITVGIAGAESSVSIVRIDNAGARVLTQ